METQLENKRLLLSYISEVQELIAMLQKNREESLEILCTTKPCTISEDRHRILKDMILLSAQDLHVARNDLSRWQNALIDVEERIRGFTQTAPREQ